MLANLGASTPPAARSASGAGAVGAPARSWARWPAARRTSARRASPTPRAAVRCAGDERFRVASITKPFTATLAVSLAEDGQLDLDEPVALALPASGVTLRHLLSHLGGFAARPATSRASATATTRSARSGGAPGCARSCRRAVVVVQQRRLLGGGALCARRPGRRTRRRSRPRARAARARATGIRRAGRAGHVQPRARLAGARARARRAYPRARRPAGGLVSTASDLLRFAAVQLDDDRLAQLREPQATPAAPTASDSRASRSRRRGLEPPGAVRRLPVAARARRRDVMAFAILTNGTAETRSAARSRTRCSPSVCGVRRPRPTVGGAWRARRAPGRYASAEVESTSGRRGWASSWRARQPDRRFAVACRRLDAPRSPRTFAIVGGQWADDVFDFRPADGPLPLRQGRRPLVPR